MKVKDIGSMYMGVLVVERVDGVWYLFLYDFPVIFLDISSYFPVLGGRICGLASTVYVELAHD